MNTSKTILNTLGGTSGGTSSSSGSQYWQQNSNPTYSNLIYYSAPTSYTAVGIGTQWPSAMLDVAGTAHFGGNTTIRNGGSLYFQGTDLGTANSIIKRIDTTAGDTWVPLVYVQDSGGNAGFLVKGDFVTSTNHITYEARIAWDSTISAPRAHFRTNALSSGTITTLNFWGTNFDLVYIHDNTSHCVYLGAKILGQNTPVTLHFDVTLSGKTGDNSTNNMHYSDNLANCVFANPITSAIDGILSANLTQFNISAYGINEWRVAKTGGVYIDNSVSIGGTLSVSTQSTFTNSVSVGTTLSVSGNMSASTAAFSGAISSMGYIDKINGVIWGSTSFDFNTGSNYWMNSGTPQSTNTINFTNMTATSGNSYTFVLILPTVNASNYYNITTCQVAGTTTGVTFKSNISSLATPSTMIVQTFTCMCLNTTWYVITSATSF